MAENKNKAKSSAGVADTLKQYGKYQQSFLGGGEEHGQDHEDHLYADGGILRSFCRRA